MSSVEEKSGKSYEHNPSMSLLQDRDSSGGGLLNDGSRGKSLWRIEYNFTTLYKIPQITVATMDSLSHRLRTNQSWFDTYFRTNAVNMEDSGMCNTECKQIQTCAISHVDYAEYQYCVERGDGVTVGGRAYDVMTATSSMMSSSVMTMLVLTIGVVQMYAKTLLY